MVDKVLYFSAEWCAPCKRLKPVIKQLREDYPEVSFEEVDADANPERSAYYSIRSVPTLIALQENKEVSRLSGLRPKQEVASTLGLE